MLTPGAAPTLADSQHHKGVAQNCPLHHIQRPKKSGLVHSYRWTFYRCRLSANQESQRLPQAPTGVNKAKDLSLPLRRSHQLTEHPDHCQQGQNHNIRELWGLCPGFSVFGTTNRTRKLMGRVDNFSGLEGPSSLHSWQS